MCVYIVYINNNKLLLEQNNAITITVNMKNKINLLKYVLSKRKMVPSDDETIWFLLSLIDEYLNRFAENNRPK